MSTRVRLSRHGNAPALRDRHPRLPSGPAASRGSGGHALAVGGVLLVALAVYTALELWWRPFIWVDNTLNRNYHVHWLWPVLHVTDRIGQRAVCLPVLAGVLAVVCWRRRAWQPVVTAAVAVLAVNVLVGTSKLALARSAPLSDRSFFADGDLYPSGHTANVVAVYGICCFLLTRYGCIGSVVRRSLRRLWALATLVMFATSLLLRWHWFGDLVAGLLAGGAVLALAIAANTALARRTKQVVTAAEPVSGKHAEPPDGERDGGERFRLTA